MRGRKPAPKPFGDVVELPPSVVRIPPCPDTLPGVLARECWDSVAREMVARNLYADDCRDLLEAYCIQRARFLEASRQIAMDGVMVATDNQKSARVNPWIRIANGAFDRLLRAGSELGLSPVSRQRAAKARANVSAAAMKFLKP
jgi:P27 family predicted phage terminase small subunit